MFMSYWLKSRPAAKRSTQPANRFRLAVEALEDRCLRSVSFFLANDGVHGMELWKTDGTPGGTAMVKDINPGASDAGIRDMTE
jgi:ELWxxDGT repeat protein